MAGKSVLIDVSKCIGCRGCQVACKQWNELPAEKTKNRGTYQNPPDLSGTTYTVVRFKEVFQGGDVKWNFFKDQCRHCVDPPCKMAADDEVPGAIVVDDNGAVIYTDKTKQLKEFNLQESCPFDIPRWNAVKSLWVKCTFCNDRVANGLTPACVKACPTGTLTFGDRDKILNLARARLKELKADYPNAELMDAEDVRWIYLLHEAEDQFEMGLLRGIPSMKFGLRRVFSPMAPVWVTAGLLGMLFKRREEGMKRELEEVDTP
ncbi:MAG: 4Fe-4S dicluster domain-containing protein [bacterium]